MLHPIGWLSCLEEDTSLEDLYHLPRGMTEEIAYSLSDFMRYGQNIFLVPGLYEDAGSERELSEIEVESFQLPSDCIYLVFPESFSLRSPITQQRIEGAYLKQSRHRMRGMNEGSLTVTIVPEFKLAETGEDQVYEFTFEYFANARGYIAMGESTNFAEHLARRFENPYERQGKFNFEQMNRDSGFASGTYEEAVKDWKPSEADLLWKEVGDEAIKAAINFAEFFQSIGQRTFASKLHIPASTVNL